MPIKTQTETELIQKIASFYWEKHMGQPEIAKRLHISQVQVSRYLKRARDERIVTIAVRSPDLSRLEQKLIQQLDLKDVKLVYGDEENVLYCKIGQELAKYFEEIVRDGFKISIAGSRVMRYFVETLSSMPREVEIYPLTLWGVPSFAETVNPSILLSILYHKFRPKAKCFRYELPLLKNYDLVKGELERNIKATRNALKASDILLTGVGYLDQNSQVNPFVYLSTIKKIPINKLLKKGIVGNIFTHLLNKEGQEVLPGFGLEDYFLELLSLEDLKKLAADKSKYIIVASGGKKRLPIIKACLKARLFNVLITDHETGESLLK